MFMEKVFFRRFTLSEIDQSRPDWGVPLSIMIHHDHDHSNPAAVAPGLVVELSAAVTTTGLSCAELGRQQPQRASAGSCFGR